MGQPSEGVKNILEAAGIGVLGADTGWSIRISRTKDKPDTLITLYDAPGRAPEPGLDINEPSVQVIVRGAPNGYRDAYAKCLRIKDELLGLPYTVMPPDNDVWASVTMPRDIMSLGYDENERPIFSLNFDLIIHQGDLSRSYRESTGSTGSPGGSGGGGVGSTPVLTSGGLLAVPAGAVINGHRVVRFDAAQAVVHANNVFPELEAIVGISENAASLGSAVSVRYAGAIEFSGWSWTPGQAVFCGADGVLTSLSGSGPVRQVAVALTATAVKVDLRPTMVTI